MTPNPTRHSCAATARFGPATRLSSRVRLISRSAPKNPMVPHPILSDTPAIEAAVASLLKLSKQHAITRGVTPEHDMAANQFKAEHGNLAALIADPVSEAAYQMAMVLLVHLAKLNRPEDSAASSARIEAMAGPESRYAADKRPRH